MTLGLAAGFAPFQVLAAELLPHAFAADDGSHDASHLLRVWNNASAIHRHEGGDVEALAVAVLLHDCVSVEKNSPHRASASRLAANKASKLLRDLGWAADRIKAVAHAIEAHSYSAGITPESHLAKMLQDADRLDAIGMVGVARCFYIGGRMGSGLYDPLDPRAATRNLDDNRFAIDHFQTKLFKLTEGFQTVTGRHMATERQKRLHRFYEEFFDEIGA
ncbi:HD domain-containing protein [Devosia rhodophyticola]|uniref:HD domain-containing protein n=2 Tax=Devosia rhodophyticola TaxID=3026423 RepID=A0ABY7YYT1_9HYPH|nr:HD domain-containing protein [Devosia rhodophyticola]WDR06543.1 HD domain-containing protein [Devosia rhodophyticola]